MIPLDTIQRIAAACDIVEVIGGTVPLKKTGATYTGLCPNHQEKTPSFTVWPTSQRFKCFGCGARGDVFAYIVLTENTTFPQAVRHLADRAGIFIEEDDAARKQAKVTVAPRPSAARKLEPDRPPLAVAMHQSSRRELVAVADWRGLSLAGMELAAARGLLHFGSPRGCPSWIVTDSDGRNAQARRMDGGVWPHIGGAKAWTLPGRKAAWPIGAREAGAFPAVALVEGGPDLLAAHHFIMAESREDTVAAVAITGAANSLPEDALLLLAHKRVRIYPHLDTAGRAAAGRWTVQLERVGCEVDAFSFEGLRRTDGSAVGDLNDLAAVDADDFEAERSELEGILPQ